MRTGSRDAGSLAEAGWLPLVLLVPFVLSGMVDLPRALHIGPISMLGAFSIIQVGLGALAIAVVAAYARRVVVLFLPYFAFLAWMFGRSIVDVPDQNGFQNAFVYVLFAVQAILAGTVLHCRRHTGLAVISTGFAVLDVMAIGLSVLNFGLFGLPTETGDDLAWLIGPRAVALLAIAPLAWHLSGWSHGRPGAGIRAVVWIVTVMASLSRTATAVALVAATFAFVAQAWTMPRRLVRQMPWLIATAGVASVLIAVYAAQFHERFLEGYNNVEIGGVSISTSGRDSIWPVVIASAMHHPIVGSGLGSSQAAVLEFDPEVVGHPHNDYLRVWHDGGAIGLVLLMLAFSTWLVALTRQWVAAVREGHGSRPDLPFAAILALIGILLAAITDNGFVYGYVMGPAGVLTGAALGLPAAPGRRGWRTPARISRAVAV